MDAFFFFFFSWLTYFWAWLIDNHKFFLRKLNEQGIQQNNGIRKKDEFSLAYFLVRSIVRHKYATENEIKSQDMKADTQHGKEHSLQTWTSRQRGLGKVFLKKMSLQEISFFIYIQRRFTFNWELGMNYWQINRELSRTKQKGKTIAARKIQ